jgi:hypothetical protein
MINKQMENKMKKNKVKKDLKKNLDSLRKEYLKYFDQVESTFFG